MSVIDYAPNNQQMAVALLLCHASAFPRQAGSKKNIMAVIPPGKGKTRIAIATALMLLCKFKNSSKVIMVWPNALQSQQD